MPRPVISLGLIVLIASFVRADNPQPLWELNLSGGKKDIGPGWISYSPDGQAIAAVIVQDTREKSPVPAELRVWNSNNHKERFKADLGVPYKHYWGDELAAFPSENTILTGGQQDLVVRNLDNGQVTMTQNFGVFKDFNTVWSVPDLQDSYSLKRKENHPPELLYQSSDMTRDQFGRGIRRGGYQFQFSEQIALHGPREGMELQAVTMNPGRTRLVASFSDVSGKHMIVMFRVRTVEEFELVPIAEVVSPNNAVVTAMTFTRNGKTLITGGADGAVSLWDLDDFEAFSKPRSTVSGVSTRYITNLTVSRDWRFVAAASLDMTKPNLMLIDVDSGKLLQATRIDGDLWSVAFSPDAQTLLTGSNTGKLRAWDVASLVKDYRNTQGLRP